MIMIFIPQNDLRYLHKRVVGAQCVHAQARLIQQDTMNKSDQLYPKMFNTSNRSFLDILSYHIDSGSYRLKVY